VKAAFTRSYNKAVHLTPYSTGAATKKRGRQAAGADEDTEDIYDETEQQMEVEKRDSDNSDDDIATDRMIVVLHVCDFLLNIKCHFLIRSCYYRLYNYNSKLLIKV